MFRNPRQAWHRMLPHRPDVEALSAYADGRLDAPAAARVEAHLASCGACRARVEGLREVRTMLRSLPEAEPPRSFRIRPLDLTSGSPVPGSPFVRLAPALGAAAVIAFAVVLGVDLSSGGDGSRSRLPTAAQRSAPESAKAPPPAETSGSSAAPSV